MSSSDHPSHASAIGLAVLVTVLWSTSWVLIRWGLDDELLPPLSFAALRYALAASVLVAWVASRPRHRRALRDLDRTTMARIVGLGVALYAVTQGAQFIAIDSQPAATTSLVLSATPLMVALLSERALTEAPTFGQLGGAILVIGGASLFFSGSLGASTVGIAAALVGLVANSGSAILGRSINRPGAVPAIVVTTLSMAVGAVALVLVALVVEGRPAVSLRAWALISWLAIVNTAFAFTLWNVSLRRLSAIESAGINNTMLVQIGLLAWWLLDEPPGARGLAGIVLVSAGIFLTQTRHSTNQPRKISAR